VLVAHLSEHRGCVQALASSASGALLLSGGDDETVKVR
jgi:WD40 repeat protein